MNTVLIVSITFPPDSEVGSLRPGSFAKYLAPFGWMPLTITRKLKNIERIDASEVSGLAKYGRVMRVSSLPHPMLWYRQLRVILGKPHGARSENEGIGNGRVKLPLRSFIRQAISTLLYIPDEYWGWIPFAVACGVHMVKKERIKVMYSTAPPWSSHVAGLLIQAATGCRWIADFRDPWSRNPWRGLNSLTGFSNKIDGFFEELTVRRANRIICVTDENADDLKAIYRLAEQKVSVIPNGYDDEEVNYTSACGIEASRFTLTHLGDLYGRRDPMPLIEAVMGLVDKGLVSKENVVVRFVGNFDFDRKNVRKMLREKELDQIVEILPRVSRREAVGYLLNSHVLVLIQGDAILQVPVKLYEYLASGKPILGLASGGAARRIIERESAGVVLESNNIEGIEGAIFDYYRKWDAGELRSRDVTSVRRFDRKSLTGIFARVLDDEIGRCTKSGK